MEEFIIRDPNKRGIRMHFADGSDGEVRGAMKLKEENGEQIWRFAIRPATSLREKANLRKEEYVLGEDIIYFKCRKSDFKDNGDITFPVIWCKKTFRGFPGAFSEETYIKEKDLEIELLSKRCSQQDEQISQLNARMDSLIDEMIDVDDMVKKIVAGVLGGIAQMQYQGTNEQQRR